MLKTFCQQSKSKSNAEIQGGAHWTIIIMVTSNSGDHLFFICGIQLSALVTHLELIHMINMYDTPGDVGRCVSPLSLTQKWTHFSNHMWCKRNYLMKFICKMSLGNLTKSSISCQLFIYFTKKSIKGLYSLYYIYWPKPIWLGWRCLASYGTSTCLFPNLPAERSSLESGWYLCLNGGNEIDSSGGYKLLSRHSDCHYWKTGLSIMLLHILSVIEASHSHYVAILLYRQLCCFSLINSENSL